MDLLNHINYQYFRRNFSDQNFGCNFSVASVIVV